MSGPLRGLGAPVGDQHRERLILTAWAAFWLVTAYLLIASCLPS